MHNDTERAFYGVCVRLRDGIAYFEVRGQFDGASPRDLSHSSHNLFPPHGEVEVRCDPANPVGRGDWLAFRTEQYGPPGHVKFRGLDPSRLLPFEDLSDVGDAESVRRLLVEDGRVNDYSGSRYVRIGDREMVLVDIRQGEDRRWRIQPQTDLWRLAVWEYRSELRLIVRDGSNDIPIVDPNAEIRQVGTVMWSSDAELFAR